MKILNLLEGNNTELFHITSRGGLEGMIELGGVSLSMLNHNPGEKEVVDSAGYSGSKLYYLSMSRMRRNSFADLNSSKYQLSGRLKFDARKLSRYGKIVPVNFHSLDGERGETEDRLISDHPMLPWSVVEYIEVYVPKHVTHHDRVVMATLSDLVELRVFNDFEKFQTGRGWTELSNGVSERYHKVPEKGIPERDFELLIKFIKTGDLTDSEAEYISSKIGNLAIRRVLTHGSISRKQHAMLLGALRDRGISGDEFYVIDDKLKSRVKALGDSSDEHRHFWEVSGFDWYSHLKSEIGSKVVANLEDFRHDVHQGIPDEILLSLFPKEFKKEVGLNSCYVDVVLNSDPDDDENYFDFQDGHLKGRVYFTHTRVNDIGVKDVLDVMAEMCSVIVKNL